MTTADSNYERAMTYIKGDGVEKSAAKATAFLIAAADAGHTKAQYNLGVMYLNGIGTEKSLERAVERFQQAASKGHEQARRSLEKIGKASNPEPSVDIKLSCESNTTNGNQKTTPDIDIFSVGEKAEKVNSRVAPTPRVAMDEAVLIIGQLWSYSKNKTSLAWNSQTVTEARNNLKMYIIQFPTLERKKKHIHIGFGATVLIICLAMASWGHGKLAVNELNNMPLMMSDEIYANAYNLTNQFTNSPQCQILAQTMMQWASPSAGSAEYRLRVLDNLYEKVQRYNCM